jgi:multidrug resistance efflux pump
VGAADQPIPTPLPQRIAEFRQRRLPVLVWCAAAITCAVLLVGRGAHYEYIGLAQALSYEVSAPMTGQLESVFVDVYDEVDAGDVLVRLDDTELAARLERSLATVRQLSAEVEATRSQVLATGAQTDADWTNNLRRFQTNEEERRLSMLELQVAVESGEIEQERLALETARAATLLETGLVGQAEYDSIRLTHVEVTQRNEDNRILLAQTEQEYLAAQGRRREFERGLPSRPDEEPFLRPLREAVTAETQRLDEIRALREALVLRSPISGQISQVLCRQGQAVVPGEPIMTIAELGVKEIVTFLAETDDRVVQRQSLVRVASLRRPARATESYVVRLGPGVELMPERLWRDPAIPSYGRAVVIAANPALNLTPGELIQVKFLD